MISKEYVERQGGVVARVIFTLPEALWADRVCLVGDFNDWNRSSHPLERTRDGTYAIVLELECCHAYQFRYLCDDREWMNDPKADAYVYNPFGTTNCVVIADPSFKPHCDEADSVIRRDGG